MCQHFFINLDAMKANIVKFLAACALAAPVSAAVAAPADASSSAAQEGTWLVSVSPFTEHFRHSPDHKRVWAFGLERVFADQTLLGVMRFSNSFGQPSAYAYYGWNFPSVFPEVPQLYLKVTVGMLYGYVSPYNDMVPLNYNGFSPAIIPAIGWQFDKNWSAQVNLLGTAAVMLMINRGF
jgi:hypothetical protein